MARIISLMYLDVFNQYFVMYLKTILKFYGCFIVLIYFEACEHPTELISYFYKF